MAGKNSARGAEKKNEMPTVFKNVPPIKLASKKNVEEKPIKQVASTSRKGKKDSSQENPSLQTSETKKTATPKTIYMRWVRSGFPVHVLLRIKSEDGKTINAHESIIVSKGTAIIGKIGKGLGATFIETLNSQIARDVKTYLFLTTREGWNGPYVTYRCRLRHIMATLPEAKKDLVPRYYASDYKDIEAWFEISSISKMSRADMNRISVISSGREIMSVIGSSASVFHVGWKEGAAT